MSGDIGRGATRETISFAVHMASMSDRPPGKGSKNIVLLFMVLLYLLLLCF
jgi:hypothetical protein